MTANDHHNSKASASDEPREQALEFYDVLKEEHERLGGLSLVKSPPYYALDHITNLIGFADRLRDALAASIVSEDFPQFAQRRVAEEIDKRGWDCLVQLWTEASPTNDVRSSSQRVIIDALNAVIDGDRFAKDLRKSKLPLHLLDPFVESMLKGELAEDRRELHRRLLDVAFSAEVASIRDIRLAALYGRIHKTRRSALCLSGGGIRSAAFALGVVQGFARNDLLDKIDYLSTVSGGGYLGGWLSAWSTRTRFDQVIDDLKGVASVTLNSEPAPVRHLRSFSNYLSPRLGVLSADTWAMLATYLRNLLLMWLVLIPLLAAIAMIPRITVAFVRWNPSSLSDAWAVIIVGVLGGAGFLSGATAVAYVHKNRPDLSAQQSKHTRSPIADRDQSAFIKRCLVPLLLATVFLTTSWIWLAQSGLLVPGVEVPFFSWHFYMPYRWYLPINFALFGGALHLFGWLQVAEGSLRERLRDGFNLTLTGAVSGSLAYLVVSALSNTMHPHWAESYVTLASPACLALVMIGAHIYTGWTSRRNQDSEREWSARYSAWVLIPALTWLVASSLILFGPILFQGLHPLAFIEANLIGVLSGIATITLARSPHSGNDVNEESRASGWTEIAKTLAVRYGLALAAPVFAGFFVVLLSLMDGQAVHLVACLLQMDICQVRPVKPPDPLSTVLVTILVAAALAWFGLRMSKLIDTNRFSLHAMYRARLIRAFLGASRMNGERTPDPFTGFDELDNVSMDALWPAKTPVGKTPPMHVVNMTLNLVGGERLAWQERKAASFTATALHAGSATVGYRRTSAAEGSRQSPSPKLYGGRISLGTAVTISGAAASPNMGYHSSPALTFLMTLFNVRLGCWLGNPGPSGDKTFNESTPRGALAPIVDEMFGLTNERNEYVYLSDGGHFDNLGLYEMVQRRCKLIVVCDAGADVRYSFEDLGNAIRKIRIDLGVPIEFAEEFNILPRVARETQADGKYWARGRIRYSCADKPSGDPHPDTYFDGDFIYFKPAFYGSEPRDVFNYAVRHPDFPHEATSDQFFNESQFESYRALGSHIVEKLCADVGGLLQPGAKEAEPPRGTFAWLAFKAGGS